MKHWQEWAAMCLLLGVPAPEVAANPRLGEERDLGFPELPVVAQGNGEERKAEADRLSSEGFQFLQTDRFPEARDNFQEALVIYREIGVREAFPQESRLQEGITLASLGKVYFFLAQYPEALKFYQQALFIHREIGVREAFPQESRSWEGTTLNNLGLVYENLGQYPQALEFYQQALASRREVGDRYGEGVTLNNLGSVYNHLRQHPKALEYYQQALGIFQEISDSPEERRRQLSGEGVTLNNLGSIYDYLGQYPRALEYYQQSLFIRREVGDRFGEGVTLGNLGLVHHNQKEYPKAIEYYQQALFIAREIGDRYGEGTVLNNLGNVYDRLEDYPQALELYEQALFISKEIGDLQGEGGILNNLGSVYEDLEEYPKAIEYYQQALAILKKVGDPSGEGTALGNIGAVYLNLEQYPEAEQYLFETAVIWESLRPSQLGDADKISIFDTQAYTYRLLQKALIAQNKIETALEISERGRSRAFVELMAQRQQGNASEEFIPPAPPTLADIQHVARTQNATLVEYSVIADEFLYIWVISPDGNIAFRSVEIAKTTAGLPLEELVNNTRFSMGVRNRSIGIVPRDAIEIFPKEGDIATQETSLQTLHQLLIEPIAHLLPKTPEERVIFVPHNELFLVPFPALQDANGTDLIDQHTILTAPAIQVLQLTGGRGDRDMGGQGEVLVVGNPVMPSISLNPGDPPVQLSSLPGAETEAKTIAQLLGTEPLIGRAATEPVVTEWMKTARIVHLATHGILDDEGGIGSSIALTPGNTSRGIVPNILDGNDGFLTAEEILGLNLNADLVVLSACDTGRGKITGDGVVGLSRSLMTVGVSSLVVSLWSVPDAPTAELMTQFYENLQQGLDKATALRNAMLTTRETYPEPVNWAAFTLIGAKE